MEKIYPKVLLLLTLFLAPVLLKAQDSHTSDTDRKWYLPDHAVAQFAGNIGLISAGAGYSYFKDKVQSDIVYGYVPAFEKASDVHILTIKTAYRIKPIQLKNDYQFTPFRIGTGISYSIGPQFYTRWPGRYPEGYYWWTTSFRFTPFMGPAISKKVGTDYTMVKRIEMYGDIGSHDLDIVAKWKDPELKLWDIINFAVGVRAIF